MKLKDIVQNEWREQYDREEDTGVIVEEKDGLFLVARANKDKEGWAFTGQQAWRPESSLTSTNVTFEETGLEL